MRVNTWDGGKAHSAHCGWQQRGSQLLAGCALCNSLAAVRALRVWHGRGVDARNDAFEDGACKQACACMGRQARMGKRMARDGTRTAVHQASRGSSHLASAHRARRDRRRGCLQGTSRCRSWIGRAAAAMHCAAARATSRMDATCTPLPASSPPCSIMYCCNIMQRRVGRGAAGEQRPGEGRLPRSAAPAAQQRSSASPGHEALHPSGNPAQHAQHAHSSAARTACAISCRSTIFRSREGRSCAGGRGEAGQPSGRPYPCSSCHEDGCMPAALQEACHQPPNMLTHTAALHAPPPAAP